jgi:hypothetical protein
LCEEVQAQVATFCIWWWGGYQGIQFLNDWLSWKNYADFYRTVVLHCHLFLHKKWLAVLLSIRYVWWAQWTEVLFSRSKCSHFTGFFKVFSVHEKNDAVEKPLWK